MSISSIAEDSALRLTAPAPTTISLQDVVTRAAATAKRAVADNVSPEQAEKLVEEEARVVPPAGDEKARVEPSPLTQLMKYIPSETIVLYIAVLGALGDVTTPPNGTVAEADFASRWWWAGVMLVATFVLTAGLSYRSQKNANKDKKFRFPWFEVLAACAAFTVWALSLPTTPLRDIAGYNYSAWSSVLILAGTVIIGVVAYVLGKTVTWEKVVEV